MKKKQSKGVKKAPKKPLKKSTSGGIQKQYLKSGQECRVTFKLPKEAAPESHRVNLVGDFNDWDASATPMKRLKSGDYKLIVKLPSKREYRFRYLIDENRWENDWCADRYVPNKFGCDDSIVAV
jgi:1,4-alpha-glucan branching enzyme